jgi:competence protein ComEA
MTTTPGEGEPHPFGWTSSQRRVLITLLLILCAYFGVRLACNRTYVSDPPPARGPRYDEVADKIDPNTADVETLSALPMIGEKRAQDIVAYREAHRTSPDQVVFKRPEDLVLIHGFGRASVETLRPYLMFPQQTPTTATAPAKSRAL